MSTVEPTTVTEADSKVAAMLRSPIFLVWVVLTVATCVSWWLGDGHGDNRAATVGVIAVAFVKVQLVGTYFMELRFAPKILQALFSGWVVVVGTALVVMYLAG